MSKWELRIICAHPVKVRNTGFKSIDYKMLPHPDTHAYIIEIEEMGVDEESTSFSLLNINNMKYSIKGRCTYDCEERFDTEIVFGEPKEEPSSYGVGVDESSEWLNIESATHDFVNKVRRIESKSLIHSNIVFMVFLYRKYWIPVEE